MASSGNAFLSQCDGTRDTMCLGYAAGVYDGIVSAQFFSEEKGICFPSGMTYGQTLDVLLAWLRNDPAQRHLSMGVLSYIALRKNYPCPARTTK